MCATPTPDLPPTCPQCSGQGIAHLVEIKNQLRTVQYECERCSHTWHLTTTDKPYWLWAVVVRSPAAESPEHAAEEPHGEGDEYYITDEH
jgi:uncharacterized Zn finger protein